MGGREEKIKIGSPMYTAYRKDKVLESDYAFTKKWKNFAFLG